MAATDKALVQKDQSSQQVAARSEDEMGRYVEEEERYSSAKAQGSINLNIFAAISGAFSSKNKKKTKTTPNEDGSVTERTTEESQSAGHARGIGYANMNAAASAEAREGRRKIKQKEEYEGTRMMAGQADHLGIEAAK